MGKVSHNIRMDHTRKEHMDLGVDELAKVRTTMQMGNPILVIL